MKNSPDIDTENPCSRQHEMGYLSMCSVCNFTCRLWSKLYSYSLERSATKTGRTAKELVVSADDRVQLESIARRRVVRGVGA